MAADPDFMTSLARGLAVINAFSQQRPQQSISQLSLKTSIPRAAVRRCLITLARLGYVGHDPERLVPRLDLVDPEPGLLEDLGDRVPLRLVVVDEEDGDRRQFRHATTPRRPGPT